MSEIPPLAGCLLRWGVKVVDYSDVGTPEAFFGPFTQTSYWLRQELRVEFPQDGTYYLLVFDQGGATGKYVLAVGEREEFGIGDLVSFLGGPHTVEAR